MEEDEDTYGFGSFSDLFAAAPAAAKHLDVGALSRFCVPERVLSRWQQQRRDSCSVSYQHVAAKFDGVSIDGGLGALSFASLEGGGVVWQQTAATDSDALERRKKELQDITNQPQNDVKSAAAVFVKLEQVEAVQATSVQNKVQGVEMLLKDGNRLEVAFMPGPFYKATHRDEFLALLKEKVTTEREGNEATQNGLTGGLKIQLGEAGGNNTVEVRGRRMPAGEEDSVKKEKFRKLVRRYTQLDELSSEALIIAKQVQEGTGYHLGPTAKDIPKFSADAAYRKKTIVELTGYVERMNQEWKEADRQRELHTKAKHSRNDDDLFEYTDTDTGEQVPVRTYEQRYLTFVKAHEVNPVLHLCPVPEKKTHDEVSLKARKAVLVAPAPQRSTLTASPKANENLRRLSSMFTATLGIDISSSCVIDKDFFSPAAALTQSDVPAHRNEDKAFRAIVDNARVQLWNSWRDAFVQACNDRTHEVSRQHHDEYQSKMTSVDKKVSSSGTIMTS
ncbi:hypothetical protein PHYBOEH_011781 [Phytophthora boehmeriae]|uniref:Uncharacterized protein n=1 Tax=Phytophthora boehmeriae TaxID=109152 RepID=A0A8T1X2Y3_9STRA|nr:hypothetical protein PHYBOEH_011781 [Phytophthora boehmeriae]